MHIMQTFIALLKSRDADDFVEFIFAFFAAPVVRGVKCGSLVNIRRNGEEIPRVWRRRKNELLARYGLEAAELPPFSSKGGGAFRTNAVLLLVYDRRLLEKALFSEEALAILRPLGYEEAGGSVLSFIERLKRRFAEGFPHEIGLFLGYPPHDVRGFMADGGRGAVASGYWKVYANVAEAMETFGAFRRAEQDAAMELVLRFGAMQVGA